MHDIAMQEMTPDFLKCWQAAGDHIDKQVQGGMKSWLRAQPSPPFLEHLSFRLGNQVFFVRVEDADGRIDGPGSLRGLLMIADGCNGRACVMPMKKKFLGGGWVAAHNGWGLVDAKTGELVDPAHLVTEEKIEMTKWELQDFAVQVVRTQLEKEGYQLMSWQGNPDVDPAIWFIGGSKGPEWVVVRAVRYPDNEAIRPANWSNIADSCTRQSKIGHFAQVAFASTDQPFQSADETPVPLWRGHGVHVRYNGLERSL
ncbi:MAG: hypothetical protein Q7K57_29100 [Burkholderiaceae bacterium]|nr:hypothetical protein [Burkholderiaceae bacterium]